MNKCENKVVNIFRNTNKNSKSKNTHERFENNVLSFTAKANKNRSKLPETWEPRYSVSTVVQVDNGKNNMLFKIVNNDNGELTTFTHAEFYQHQSLIKKLAPEQIISLVYSTAYEKARHDLQK